MRAARGPRGDLPATAELVENLEEAFDERGTFDFNDQKDVYANLDYEVWLRGVFTFGGYYYRGTTGFLLDPDDPDSFVEDGNSFDRWGARFRWEQEQGFLTILAAASFGNDELDRGDGRCGGGDAFPGCRCAGG